MPDVDALIEARTKPLLNQIQIVSSVLCEGVELCLPYSIAPHKKHAKRRGLEPMA